MTRLTRYSYRMRRGARKACRMGDPPKAGFGAHVVHKADKDDHCVHLIELTDDLCPACRQASYGEGRRDKQTLMADTAGTAQNVRPRQP